jgi:hypothetical protein
MATPEKVKFLTSVPYLPGDVKRRRAGRAVAKRGSPDWIRK